MKSRRALVEHLKLLQYRELAEWLKQFSHAWSQKCAGDCHMYQMVHRRLPRCLAVCLGVNQLTEVAKSPKSAVLRAVSIAELARCWCISDSLPRICTSPFLVGRVVQAYYPL